MVVVILNGQIQLKKEMNYGRQDMKYIIQLKLKLKMEESIQQMYVCQFQNLLNVLTLQK